MPKRVRSVDEWVVLLSSPSASERELAVEGLGDALGAEDGMARERAAEVLLEALARPGAAVGPLLSVLQSAWWPPPVRLAGTAMQAVVVAVSTLDAANAAVEDAAFVLANVCRVAPAQCAAVDAALEHPRPAVRRAAAGAVGRMGEAAVPLLPRLIPLLDDEEDVAGAALESMGALASLAPGVAMPALLEHIRTAEGARLYLALTALRSLVEDARREGRPLPSLQGLEASLHRAVKEGESAIRVEALTLVGLMGAASAELLERVSGRLEDTNPSVAACAAVALLRLGAPSQAPVALLEFQLRAVEAPEQQAAALSALEDVEPATWVHARDMLKRVADTASGPTRDALRALLEQLV
ncbi:hypothetical protein [Myxococcus sp. Y35]|uniref:hypothetical protein n=1 Tax=Pseudomyxococcus flavus TaxID=3115648 RepID=UPI003CEB8BC8